MRLVIGAVSALWAVGITIGGIALFGGLMHSYGHVVDLAAPLVVAVAAIPAAFGLTVADML